MRHLLRELRHRRVFRVAIIYTLSAWVITQAADILVPALHLPAWFTTLVVALLVLGFPIAMVLAWAFDVGPKRISRTAPQNIDGEKRVAAMLVYGAMLAVGTGLLFIALYPGELVRRTEVSTQAERIPAESQNSIAVLPFVNMSADPDNEYFSDGISEELLNALAKVPGLKVAARTSAFQFKGQHQDIKEVGEKLGVNTVLEGSVRKAGNRVRITAQLINVSDGYHLWSESYDRELENIFALQDEIATAIVDALAVTLDGEAVQAEGDAPTDNIEAYQSYLRGRHLWRQRGAGQLHQSIALLKKAIELDPGFARAYSNLADAYAILKNHDPSVDRDLYFSLAESSARKALAIDPELGEAHAVLGFIFLRQQQWLEAGRALRTAVLVGPDDPVAHYRYANYLLETGYTRHGLVEIERAYELDPLNAAIANWRSAALLQAGRNEAGLEYARIAAELGDIRALRYQGLANWRLGNDDLAEKLVIEGFSIMGYPTDWVTLYSRALRDRSVFAEAEASIMSLQENRKLPLVDENVFVLLVLLGSEQVFAATVPVEFNFLWYEEAAWLRRDPRFIDLVEGVGFVQVWREFGWPDLCEPANEAAFQCR